MGKKLKRMLGKGSRATVGRVSHAEGNLQHEMRLELTKKGETQKTKESLGRASNIISRIDPSGKRGHLKIRRLEGGGVMYKEIGANKLAETKGKPLLFHTKSGKIKIKIFDTATGQRISYRDPQINRAIDGYLAEKKSVRSAAPETRRGAPDISRYKGIEGGLRLTKESLAAEERMKREVPNSKASKAAWARYREQLLVSKTREEEIKNHLQFLKDIERLSGKKRKKRGSWDFEGNMDRVDLS